MTIYDTRESTRRVLNQQKGDTGTGGARFYRSGLGAPSVKITVLTEKRGVTSHMTMPGQGRIAGMKTASRESATVINTFVSPSGSGTGPIVLEGKNVRSKRTRGKSLGVSMNGFELFDRLSFDETGGTFSQVRQK